MRLMSAMESSRFEDVIDADAATTTTEVEVDVRVEEEASAAAEIATAGAEIEADTEAAEEIASMGETLMYQHSILKEYGTNPGIMALINEKNELTRVTGVTLPAHESLDPVGTNLEAAQESMDALKKGARKTWEKIVAFFKSIYERIKAFVTKVVSMVVSKERAVQNAYDSVKGLKLDSKKMGEVEASLVTPDDVTTASAAFSSVRNILYTRIKGEASAVETALKGLSEKTKVLGFTVTAEGDIETFKDGLKPKEMKVSESKWTVDTAETAYKAVRATISEMREMPKVLDAFKKLTDSGRAKAESMMKGQEEDKAKADEARKTQKAASSVARIVNRTLSAGNAIPSYFISACAALRKCKEA